MQKKLIAAAVAALVSTGAMADATVYGRLDFGYRSTDVDQSAPGVATDTVKTTNTAWNAGSLTTSRLGWNVKEDLGGGMSAFGNLELGINNLATSGGDANAAGVPFNTRTAFVGLKSDAAGALSIGRQTVLADVVLGVGSVGGLNNTTGNFYNQGGVNINTGALESGKLNNTRSGNLIQYMSPKFGGVSFGVQYGNGKVDDNGVVAENDELGLMVQYSAGPLTVALGMSDEERTAGSAVVSEPSQMVLAANYDFGVAKVYALYADGDDKKLDLDATADTITLNGRDGMEIGAKFPLGATSLFASYFTGESDYSVTVVGVGTGSVKIDHSGYQLGALYSLSKRTTAYALYGSAEAEFADIPGVKTEESTIALGIRHDF